MKKFLITNAALLQICIMSCPQHQQQQQQWIPPAVSGQRDAERSVERLERYEYRNPVPSTTYYQNLGNWEERARGHW